MLLAIHLHIGGYKNKTEKITNPKRRVKFACVDGLKEVINTK